MRATLTSSLTLLSSLALHARAQATVSSPTAQMVNGIGASGAWWPIDLYNFPDSVRENVSTLLFDPTNGIGLTSYRYNLGGGGVGVGTYSRAPETPYVSDGVYNFSADPQGTYYLREAAKYGVPIITLFVNSAPTTFTSNSQNCGGSLISDRIPEYAQYLVDVISYWMTQGVNITAVSPMNEPDNDFGGSPCGQEGMIVYPWQRGTVVSTLAAALQSANLETRVIADESSWLIEFDPEALLWLDSSIGADLLGVAHHQYGFEIEASQVLFGDYARSLAGGTPTWFTEICCWESSDDPLGSLNYGATYDPTIIGGLQMASLVSQSLQWIEDAHWDFWTALSNAYGCAPSGNATCVESVNSNGWNDGLMYYDPNYNTTHDYTLTPAKRFAVLKHFTQGIPVGSIRRVINNVPSGWLAMAFDTPSSSASCGQNTTCVGALYSIILVNGQASTATLTLSGDGTLVLTQPTAMYVSDAGMDYAAGTVPTLDGSGGLTVDAPPMSMFTIYF